MKSNDNFSQPKRLTVVHNFYVPGILAASYATSSSRRVSAQFLQVAKVVAHDTPHQPLFHTNRPGHSQQLFA